MLWLFAGVCFSSNCPNPKHDTEIQASYELNEIQNGKYAIYSNDFFYYSFGKEIRRIPSNYTLIEHSISGKPTMIESNEIPKSTFIRFLFWPIYRPVYTFYIPEDSVIFGYIIDF